MKNTFSICLQFIAFVFNAQNFRFLFYILNGLAKIRIKCEGANELQKQAMLLAIKIIGLKNISFVLVFSYFNEIIIFSHCYVFE